MNTKLQEIEKQSYKLFKDEYSTECFVFSKEKFAELIVRECVKEIGYKSVDLLDIDFYPHYQERLKKHFGVKE